MAAQEEEEDQEEQEEEDLEDQEEEQDGAAALLTANGASQSISPHQPAEPSWDPAEMAALLNAKVLALSLALPEGEGGAATSSDGRPSMSPHGGRESVAAGTIVVWSELLAAMEAGAEGSGGAEGPAWLGNDAPTRQRCGPNSLSPLLAMLRCPSRTLAQAGSRITRRGSTSFDPRRASHPH